MSKPRETAETTNALLRSIDHVGTDPARGGYFRPVYSDAELTLREWFTAEASTRGLDLETDDNGIMWAWWDVPSGDRTGALITGSHLDSVPGGGAFDGPLGVASALAAVDVLADRVAAGTLTRRRALAVVVFPEEEGSRFGVACLGSRLLTGAISPERALNLKDADGRTFAEVACAHGLVPERMGRDLGALSRMGEIVELHVEQGRGINTTEASHHHDHQPAVAIGSSILGHGRWRFSIHGQGNHAGTTLMSDRADPMVAAAQLVIDIRDIAAKQQDARATIGRLQPIPGGTNVIASRVDLWMDVRHPEDGVVARLIEDIHGSAHRVAAAEGCTVELTEESYSGTVHFSPQLSRSLQTSVSRSVTVAPVLATGAGHDAGVLSSHVPAGMIFVRNPTGISHSPEEFVEDDDAAAGTLALADALEDLL